AFLLLVSGAYYYALQSTFLLVLIGMTALAYFGGIAIADAKSVRTRSWLLAVVVILGLLPLLTFKYLLPIAAEAQLAQAKWQFELSQLAVPVGLSFYTLVAIGYVADVYLGVIAAERGLWRFGLLMSFFAHVTAGPIARSHVF